jgi:nicotinamide-nucleotide amidase
MTTAFEDSALHELAVRLGEALKGRRLTLAVAESCTGGWLGQAITSVPGSSEWFDRGFVTYSNAAKEEMLGVKRERLERFGAVSEEVAREMAAGALEHSRADIAVSITGVAGPDGGTPEKPVGTVCFAFAGKNQTSHCRTQRFDGDRDDVRRQSVGFALEMLIESSIVKAELA